MDTKNQAWLDKGLGKQLLLKMGWKEGEGLGVDGQGRKGNVTVRKVTEQRGLGFNSQNEGDAGIVKQIHGLNDVLASLKAEHVTEEKTKSTKNKKSSRPKADEVEEVAEQEEKEETSSKKRSRKSKQKAESGESASERDSSASDKEEPEAQGTYKSSKRRRGYKKFLDAKDVSRYSKQDLKAILGGVSI